MTNDFILEDRLQKIRQIIGEYGEDNFAISFSGGKDSTVLSALVDMAILGNMIPRVFADTGYGNNIIKVPTMYPSSQTCSYCGYKNPLVKNLAIRSWECPQCHTKHDRDTNASINILNKGLSIA